MDVGDVALAPRASPNPPNSMKLEPDTNLQLLALVTVTLSPFLLLVNKPDIAAILMPV